MQLLVPFLLATALVAVEEPKEENVTELTKVSEAFGHLIGKNIQTLGFEFSIDDVVKGLKDSVAGIESPLSESECVQAISTAQEKLFKKQSLENLEKANEFLAVNAKEKGISSLEQGKLQFKVEKKGHGNEVQPHFSPLIRYVGKFLDGKVFGSSKEDELISLDETIPGFSKGLLGMKEGEKRTLFIHPDLAYGTGGYLPPNSLLTFEVEIVKANAAAADTDGLISSTPENVKSLTDEIAESSEKKTR